MTQSCHAPPASCNRRRKAWTPGWARSNPNASHPYRRNLTCLRISCAIFTSRSRSRWAPRRPIQWTRRVKDSAEIGEKPASNSLPRHLRIRPKVSHRRRTRSSPRRRRRRSRRRRPPPSSSMITSKFRARPRRSTIRSSFARRRSHPRARSKRSSPSATRRRAATRASCTASTSPGSSRTFRSSERNRSA